MTTLWDTTGSAVVRALAAERRMGGAVTSGNALTLVVMVDEKYVADAERAASKAAAMNPCRLLIVVRRELDAPQPRLDAEVSVGGRLGPGESVVLRMYGRLALHAESVTLPLLAPDAPVVAWWHGAPPKVIATDAVGVYADRRITDCGQRGDAADVLHDRAGDYAPGDTDLCWTRTTRWRSALASSFDSVADLPTSVAVYGAEDSPAVRLLAGWLQSRLGRPCELRPTRHQPDTPGIDGVEMAFSGTRRLEIHRQGGDLVISRTGQRDQRLTVRDRDLGDLLTEELRRQGADEIYADALAAATGVADLNKRRHRRAHVWIDPEAASATTHAPAADRPRPPSSATARRSGTERSLDDRPG